MKALVRVLTGTVSGRYTANLLTEKLGYEVFEGEPYYTPGGTTSAVSRAS